jgi:septum formation protein
MVSRGVIRERPRSTEEAREFIQGKDRASHLVVDACKSARYTYSMQRANELFRVWFFLTAYSGDRAFAVNYVLVTNLSTGGRKGGWDIPEVLC